ncbi:MAG: glycosyltransferase family 9 protein [Verrucomicrobiota bacterium]
MENILLIRLKSIGDVVLTLPAVRIVRENFPSAKITYLTSLENSVLLRGFPDVDKTMVLDREKLRGGNPLKVLPEFFELIYRLRSGKYSLVVDFQGYGETAWLARLTGAQRRWCSFYHPGRQWAYTFSREGDLPLHAADAHLELLRQGGLSLGKMCNAFALPPDALAEALAFFSRNDLDPQNITLFIQPLTSGTHKNWPLENYLAIARIWRERGVQIVFGGGPDDRAALQPVVAEDFCIAAGVPLLVTAGLLQLSSLVLGGDTGVLHLAVAQGKPVLMLMHQAAPGSPIPFQHPEWVIVAPAPEKIAQIPVPEVNAAIAARLGQ